MVPGTDPTERLGVFAVGLRAEQAGWAFRELPRPTGVSTLISRHGPTAVQTAVCWRFRSRQVRATFGSGYPAGGASTSTRPTAPTGAATRCRCCWCFTTRAPMPLSGRS